MIAAIMQDSISTLAVKLNEALMEGGLVVRLFGLQPQKGTKIWIWRVDLSKVEEAGIIHVWTFSKRRQAEGKFWPNYAKRRCLKKDA
jgi:hypothetical protein